MERVPFRLTGLVTDPPPSEVALDFWTRATNMIVRDGQMTVPAGRVSRLTDPGEPVHFLINTEGTSSWWVYVTDTGIYQTSGSSAGNIATTGTPTSFALGTWTADDVTGGLISGFPYILAAGNAPVYWAQTGNCAYVDASAPTNAKALWTFKNHCFIGHIGSVGDQVQWSDVIDPTAALTASFTASTTNQAGEVFLSDGEGEIMNGAELGRSCMIYKNGATHICDYIGGNFVFAFRLFSRTSGTLSRHSIARLPGAHVVLTQDDVVLNDGQSIQSIASGAVRRQLFADLDTDQARKSWCFYNRAQREVWVGIPTQTGGVAKAYVWNQDTARWGVRQLVSGASTKALTYVARGIAQDSSANFTYDTTTDTYASTTLTYDAAFFSADQDVVIGAEQTSLSDGIFTQQDTGDILATGTVTREQLDFGEPDTVKTITAVYLNGQFDADSTVTVIVRGRLTENGDATLAIDEINPATQQKASVRVSGRLIDVELYPSAGASIAGFTVEIARRSLH
jgi:hypothetical protein